MPLKRTLIILILAALVSVLPGQAAAQSGATLTLRHLETEIESFYRVSILTDELIGLRNAVRTAVIVAMAAWENKSSVGCHYRT